MKIFWRGWWALLRPQWYSFSRFKQFGIIDLGVIGIRKATQELKGRGR
jgi:hypothetical protein